MIQRITCALSLCLLLFIPFHDIMAGELVTRDSLNNTTDTLKNGFFHRFYRYFEQSNKVKEEKKFDFSIIGGPHFSSDTKLGLGVVASGLFRIDREDKTISPSNISLYGDVTTTGFYLLGIRGNMIFPKDRFRANINMYFFTFFLAPLRNVMSSKFLAVTLRNMRFAPAYKLGASLYRSSSFTCCSNRLYSVL